MQAFWIYIYIYSVCIYADRMIWKEIDLLFLFISIIFDLIGKERDSSAWLKKECGCNQKECGCNQKECGCIQKERGCINAGISSAYVVRAVGFENNYRCGDELFFSWAGIFFLSFNSIQFKRNCLLIFIYNYSLI